MFQETAAKEEMMIDLLFTSQSSLQPYRDIKSEKVNIKIKIKF